MGPFELLELVVNVFERYNISYFVTGSVASMAYGEPRLTNDIDIVADLNNEHIKDILISFSSPDFYVSENMIKEAIIHRSQFNIIHPASGLKVDVIIRKKTQFDESRFTRIRRIQAGETYQANFASPEDIIIKKLDYYRMGSSEKHLRDITGILKISGDDIDSDYIVSWAKKLDLEDIWNAVLKRISMKE